MTTLKSVLEASFNAQWSHEWKKESSHLFRFAVDSEVAKGKLCDIPCDREDATMVHRVRCGLAFTGCFLVKLGRRTSDLCNLCRRKETIQHTLLTCGKFDEPRRRLFGKLLASGEREITLRTIFKQKYVLDLTEFLKKNKFVVIAHRYYASV